MQFHQRLSSLCQSVYKRAATSRSFPPSWSTLGNCCYESAQLRNTRIFSRYIPQSTFSTGKNLLGDKGRKFNGVFGWYLRALLDKPILTKSVTASGILVLADSTTQIITGSGSLYERSTFLDSSRLLRMASIGLFLWGPSLHLWYGLMARILPKSDVLSILKKMALGQFLYGPSFTAIFFSISGASQGENPHEILARLKRDIPPTFFRGLFFWPVCDFLTYRFVPIHLMPLFNNFAALVWNIYVTYVASKGKAENL